jgi:hypothetical protein
MIFGRHFRPERDWSDVDWLRDRLEGMLYHYATLMEVPQPTRRVLATIELGAGRLLEREGIGSLTPAAKRLLRRASR